ncbi:MULTISPECIES: MMPL family transporter [unclassified Thioalkalivibrio]|uniref:MMPL family transporter n=1 Tax=unclassified Thioalkalivibrio TaxID=2621013 RepID=UPI0003641CB9|nr:MULTISPECIES: MMPL family transporter [unclassified Thioalkalivibrio]
MLRRHPSRVALTLWLAALLLATLTLTLRGELVTDLQGFAPDPVSADGIALDPGAGPAGRMLLLAIAGGEARERAAASDALVAALEDAPDVAGIHNGRLDPDDPALDFLIEHRYLLSPRVDAEHFSQDRLSEHLEARRDDLASAVPELPRELIPRDPTAEARVVLEQLAASGGQATTGAEGVWVTPDRGRALLVLRSAADGMDLDAQAALIERTHAAFSAIDEPNLQLQIAGPAVIAVDSRATIRGEVTWITAGASVALALLLLAVFRHPHPVWLAAVPLASGILIAAAVVTLVFGHLHGIALAFGITVLGIALDYPLHLFAHAQRGDGEPSGGERADGGRLPQVARELWPAIALGAGSTVLVYALMAMTGFSGMAQLGLFVLTGVAVAAVVTRWILPTLVPTRLQREGLPPLRLPLPTGLAQPPAIARWGLALLALAAIAVVASADPFPWEDRLSALHPVPEDQIALDQDLRSALGLPDVRHALLVSGDTPEQALHASEALTPGLETLRETEALDGFGHAANVLPSRALQRERQAALPEPDTLRERLDVASAGLGFRDGAFEPFVNDIQTARQQDLLEPEGLPDGPLRNALEPLLQPRDDGTGWIAWVRLQGVHDPDALTRWAEDAPLASVPELDGVGIRHIDFFRASEELVIGFRVEALQRLALGMVAVALLLLVVTRAPGRSLRILTAVGTGLLLTLATLILLGIQLSLFHLIAMLLITGLCLDYAVFFSRPLRDAAARLRNLRSVSVCALSTLVVFGLLALSSLPVLQAMGLTVVLGVVFSFLAAALLAPEASRRQTA